MSKYEKLGSFLLLEKIEEDKLSKTFLAGRIVSNQISEINFVKRFDNSLTSIPDFQNNLNQELDLLKGLTNPNIVKPAGFIQEKSGSAAVFEYVEGKSLRTILQKCAQEGYPFTPDHSLLIASRICTAIEYLHSKKINDQRLIHGYLSPDTTFVSYDGETKIVYMGLAHRLLKIPSARDRFFQEYKTYLAPEVLGQQKLDKAADIFGAGLVLYEMLTGEALQAKGGDVSISQSIEHAHMHNNSGEKIPVPDEIKKIMTQALSVDPAQRYASISDMRKALDEWLYSSEFAPTTFNLAFFMNSLFRETIDEDNKSISNFKKLDVAAHVKEEPPTPQKAGPVGAEAARDIPVTPAGLPKQTPSFGQAVILGGAETTEKSKTPLIIGALVGVAVIGIVAMLVMKPKDASQQATTQAANTGMTVEQQKASEVERQRLQDEAATAQEEAKKKDQELADLKSKLDQLLKAQQKEKTTTSAAPVDTAAIQQLQEQAKKLEEEKKQQEALAAAKLLAAQQAAAASPPSVPAEQTEEPKRVASATPPPVQAESKPPTQEASQPATGGSVQETPVQDAPAAASTVVEGQVVELTPDVVKPEIVNRTNPVYPPAALSKKAQGTVILSVLVSEKGDVADMKVLRSATGFDDAAKTAVKKWKFRPAVKDGKRVKVWMTIPIQFKLGS